MSCNKTILHITTHLGGGVGKVVTNYLKKSKTHSKFTHTIASLDYINEEAKEILTGIKIDYNDKLHLDIPKLNRCLNRLSSVFDNLIFTVLLLMLSRIGFPKNLTALVFTSFSI